MMVITAAIWASAFVAIKVAVVETGPLWLATWRVGIGFVILVPYAIWRGFVWPKGANQWLLIFTIALFNVVLPFFLISWAEQEIDAGIASLLMGVGPLMALVGSHMVTRDDRITSSKLIAVAFGFAGVITIVGVDALSGLGGRTLAAQLAMIVAAICYTISGLLIRKINIPPTSLVCLAFGAGLVQLIVAATLLEGAPNLDLSSTTMFALIYLGIIPTALGQIFRFSLIKKVGYSVFALALNLIPVFGIALGALILGEVITGRVFLALALVLAGLLISQLGDRNKA